MNAKLQISKRLKLVLQAQGLSIKQFSKDSGIPYRTVQDYLAGKRNPGVDHLVKLHEFGVDLVWLLTGDIDGAIKLEFPAFSSQVGLLVADKELGSAFFEACIDIVHQLNVEHLNASGEPMKPLEIFSCIWKCFELVSNIADKHSEKLVKAKHNGWTSKEITDLVVSPARELLLQKMRDIDTPDQPARGGEVVSQ